jgi:diguanylate cyclase (GGDEF)-like protein/PAS domain S-box-containing protein
MFSIFATLGLPVSGGLTLLVWLALVFLALALLTRNRALTRQINLRKDVEKTLQESKKRLSRVMEGSDQGFWDWNLKTNTVTVSDRFETMLGYDPGELDVSLENWAQHVQADDLAKAMASIQQLIAGKTAVHQLEIRCRTKSGTWRWILTRGRIVEWDAQGQPLCIAGTHTDATDRKVAAEEIEQLAYYDPLTQLPNRRLILDRLQQAQMNSERHGRQGALMLLDLDNFKVLNDTLGHDAGDQLLVAVASRLKSCIRHGDTAARLGGDEFIVILEDLDRTDAAAMQAEHVVAKIRAELGKPHNLAIHEAGQPSTQQNFQCTASIGITLFYDETVPIDELMRRADAAMNQAKSSGRDAWRFFDPEVQAIVSARAALEIDLRKAVQEEQFIVHYQAQVDSAGHIVGTEVLVRWSHPERGLISPAEFIPLAEETGLILPLGDWVLQMACRQLVAWAQHPVAAKLTISVNISARQFNQPDLVAHLLALINATGAPRDKLKLEMTESLLLENAQDVILKMNALKEHGVHFSLDDFGTGYSSLSYLRRLPLDQLKIDQSFVHHVLTDPNDAVIARAVVALAQSLGLAVIAEGVETVEQRDFLARSGCLTYQGSLFGRPQPLIEFEAALNRPGAPPSQWVYNG